MAVIWTLIVDFSQSGAMLDAEIVHGVSHDEWLRPGGHAGDRARIWVNAGDLPRAQLLWFNGGHRAWVTVTDGIAHWGDHSAQLCKNFPHLRVYT